MLGRLEVILECSGTLPGRFGNAFRPIGEAKSMISLRFCYILDDAALPQTSRHLGPSWDRLEAVMRTSSAVLEPS